MFGDHQPPLYNWIFIIIVPINSMIIMIVDITFIVVIIVIFIVIIIAIIIVIIINLNSIIGWLEDGAVLAVHFCHSTLHDLRWNLILLKGKNILY